ncbi:MAG: DUF2550 domain-containing protein [Actinomycetales bacterium]
MNGWVVSLEVVAALALLMAVLCSALLFRRFRLSRVPGAFDLSIRPVGGVWSFGVAHFGSSQLDWYQVFSLSLKPARTLERRRLSIVGRRAGGMSSGTVIVRCRYDDRDLDLALNEQAYFGLSSWSEAAPPGELHRL